MFVMLWVYFQPIMGGFIVAQDQIGKTMEKMFSGSVDPVASSPISSSGVHFVITFRIPRWVSSCLIHQKFKSCLRSLGHDLPMMEEGKPDP